MICVALFAEVPAPETGDEDDGDRPIVGYFQNFGVSAASEEEACDLVAGQIADGEIEWPASKISSDVVTRLDPAIIARSGDWTQKGIWYKSGRMFFPRD
jgi:hypothetical protein